MLSWGAMLPGLNTDVQYRMKTYHVQTEDLGAENPYILTLLYHAGTILHRVKTDYADLLARGAPSTEVATLMRRQHEKVIQTLRTGRYDREGPASLDDLILEYLLEEEGRERGRT